MIMRRSTMWLAALTAACSGAPALAAPACEIPAALATPRPEAASDRDPVRVLPIGSYTLSLIWLPQECRGHAGFDCTKARTAGFVLHGLWPDGQAKDWPQWCKPAEPLPVATLKAHYCATPNPQLIQHEWAKHGTCMAGYTPDRYLTLSNRLFAGIVQPNLRSLSFRPQTAATVQRAIARVNPGITPDMMRLNLSKKGWLQEVWLCLDTRFKPQRCGADQGGARPEDTVLIWRGGGKTRS